MALKRAVLVYKTRSSLGAGVLGDSFGAFTNGVLGEFTRKQEPYGSLDFPRSDSASLVVMSQTGSFGGDTFEDVVHETVHDAHSLAGDSSVRVDLLQDFVDVDSVAFLPLTLLLLVGLCNIFLGFTSFLHGFTTCFRRHGVLETIDDALETNTRSRMSWRFVDGPVLTNTRTNRRTNRSEQQSGGSRNPY